MIIYNGAVGIINIQTKTNWKRGTALERSVETTTDDIKPGLPIETMALIRIQLQFTKLWIRFAKRSSFHYWNITVKYKVLQNNDEK